MRPVESPTPVRFGDVCPGWLPADWAKHLEDMAGSCEAMNPGRAEELRGWAKVVRERIAVNGGDGG